jgi:Uma2 family endonuclease
MVCRTPGCAWPRANRDYDRHTKLPRYQAAGVREVWIVDLVEQALWVRRSPEPVPAAEANGLVRRRPSLWHA